MYIGFQVSRARGPTCRYRRPWRNIAAANGESTAPD